MTDTGLSDIDPQFADAGGHVLRRRGHPLAEASDRHRVLGRLGALSVRLASSPAEMRRAQALRYRVFCREMGASAGWRQHLLRRDRDRWDPVCDHLLVVDETVRSRCAATGGRIVGTYRLLRDEVAATAGLPFYSQSEFDVASLMARHRGLRFLELGRSCVLAPWRDRRTIELLWHGSWAYVLRHRIDVMIGCASFPGSDPQRFAEALSFLHHHAAPMPEWAVEARSGLGVSTAMMAASEIDARRALRALPPLIKGYLRLGARFAGEAVIDRQFGTTDVLVILPVADLNPRYVAHYGADAARHAA